MKLCYRLSQSAMVTSTSTPGSMLQSKRDVNASFLSCSQKELSVSNKSSQWPQTMAKMLKELESSRNSMYPSPDT